MADRPEDLTQLLKQLRGDPAAGDVLYAAVHDELRRLAERQLGRERQDHTLQPTALVNEAYLRLVDASGVDWQDRRHFFAIAAKVMRRVLVEHARAHRAQKRGGGQDRVTLVDDAAIADAPDVDVVALDEALTELGERSERQARLVELRFFAGLSVEEVAHALEVSETTVKADWRIAKAFLRSRLGPE